MLNARKVGRHSDGSRVYIGRPSKWGNPFVIGRDSTRAEVIAKYREWVVQPELMGALDELRGRDVVCWCAPHHATATRSPTSLTGGDHSPAPSNRARRSGISSSFIAAAAIASPTVG